MKLRFGLWLVGVLGCGSSAVLLAPSETSTPPADASTEAAVEGATSDCPRALKDADRLRKVVVSHPLGKGDRAKRFEVLDLAAAGSLTRTGVVFEMGKAGDAPIVFTTDGEIGFVAQDDGTIGVFRFDASGVPQVVHAALSGDFYAKAIAVDATGSRAYVLDPNTQGNGGGVYELAIGCDGSITPKGLVVPGGRANAMTFLPNDPTRAVLYAGKAFSSAAGADTFLLDMAGPSLVAGGDGFGDDDAIASSIAITPDGKYALVADSGLGAGNRVAVVSLPAMSKVQLLKTESPSAVVASVFGNAALVVNDDSTDEMSAVRYDPSNAAAPFSITGRVTYAFPKPQIPGSAVQLTRGALRGRVFVAELSAIRQVQFTPEGRIDDEAQTTLGGGTEDAIGTLGVQP